MKPAGARATRVRAWVLPVMLGACVAMVVLLVGTYIGLPYACEEHGGKMSMAAMMRGKGGGAKVPVIAYLLTGSNGDGKRLKRLLFAIYHPRNEYLLHLDKSCSEKERRQLDDFVQSDPTFAAVGNVKVVPIPNLVTYKGPTMTSTYLHGMAILLRQRTDWDWFINLSASDYPLLTQDDFLLGLSSLPRELNFIRHTGALGWKEKERALPMIVDPALYSEKKSDLFFQCTNRTTPTSFKLFHGEAWVVLSRAFSEYTIWGYDNLPRLALMYYTNFVSSPEGYFHTVICNSEEFRTTVVNNDLRYIQWTGGQHPDTLTEDHFDDFVASGDVFGRKFGKISPVLDKIDMEVLSRRPGYFTPGGWCRGKEDGVNDPCRTIGDISKLVPTDGVKRFEEHLVSVLEPKTFRDRQCANV